MPDRSLAGNGTLGSTATVDLFGGESKITTTTGIFLTGQTILRGTVLAKDAANKLIPWDPASGVASVKLALGVALLDMTTTADTEGPYYNGGTFNHEALIWPVAVTTLQARKAAFDRTPITVERIL